MPVFFSLLLMTAIASIIFYLRTDNDIYALLGIVTALLCLIWGLMIAHWSIHLLTLLTIFLYSKPVAVATLDRQK